MEFVNKNLNEFNEYLKGRKVAVIGLGVSNLPLLEYLHKNFAKVTIFDEKSIENIEKDIIDKINKYSFKFFFGKNSLDHLVGFDLIFRSPSCLPTKPKLKEEARKRCNSYYRNRNAYATCTMQNNRRYR